MMFIFKGDCMTIDDLIKYFGNLNKACLAINIAPQNMTSWKKYGYIPLKQQFRFAYHTEGDLIPDEQDPNLLVRPKKSKARNAK